LLGKNLIFMHCASKRRSGQYRHITYFLPNRIPVF
jgi:hypothetical protein